MILVNMVDVSYCVTLVAVLHVLFKSLFLAIVVRIQRESHAKLLTNLSIVAKIPAVNS